MKEVVKEFRYNRFSPLQNKMVEGDKKICTRPLTIEERKIVKRADFYGWLIPICGIIGFLGTLTFGVMAGVISLWFLIGVPFTIAFYGVCDWAMNKYDDCHEKMSHFNEWGFDVEQLMWEQHYDQQMLNMTIWRKQHPLEEAVRKAQESGNCVDIVEAARLYAEQYFKGVL